MSYKGLIEINFTKIETSLVDMIKKGNVLLAIDNNKTIGGAAGWVLPCGFNNDLMFMAMFFYIKKEYRRYTVIALREIEKFLSKTDCTKIVFSSPNVECYQEYNRFYRMQGYKELETHFAKTIR
jgi:hypothetical protein